MKITEYFKKLKIMRDIKNRFLEEHKLPKYSPYSGIKIKWDIGVIQQGPYDENTGKALGEFKIIISQRSPTINEIQQDNRIYQYSTEEKKLEVNEGLVWSICG